MPQRDARVEGLPEPDEDRQLDQGRQAAADRVDSVLLVKGEGLPGLLFLVVLVLLLNFLEVGLKRLDLWAMRACLRPSGNMSSLTSNVSRMIAMP